MATTINYLSLTGLQNYDLKIKAFIDSQIEAGVANSFKYVNLVDGVLKFYTVNPIADDTVADFEVTLPEQDLSHLMQLVKDATHGNIASFGEGGQVTDSGVSVADIATKAEVEAVQTAVDTVSNNLDTISAKVTKNETAIGTLDNLATNAKGDLVNAINEVRASVSAGGTQAAVSIDTSTTTDGYLKSYTLYQGDTKIGVIDIPKELMAVSGQVVVNPEGMSAGTYLELTIQNGDPVYVDVASLVDNYVAASGASQVQVAIDAETREISASLVAGGVGTVELADSAVTTVKIADGNVTKAKLSTEVQASLDKADVAASQTALDAEIERATKAEAQALADAKALIGEVEEGKTVVQLLAEMRTSANEYTDEKIAEVSATVTTLSQTHAADVKALQEKDIEIEDNVTSLTEKVTALEGVQHIEITEDEINQLF